jgi:serine/threonine protein phosphatase PrpC
VCNDLLSLALERGGTDNVTILVLRSPPKKT